MANAGDNPFGKLPVELWEHIAGYTDSPAALAATSRQWTDVISTLSHPSEHFSQFVTACERGYMKHAKWLMNHTDTELEHEYSVIRQKVLRSGLKYGDLDIVNWALKGPDRIKYDSVYYTEAIKTGNPEIIARIEAYFPNDAIKVNSWMVDDAARTDNLDILKKTYDRLPQHAKDDFAVGTGPLSILTTACRNGNRGMIDWSITTFNLRDDPYDLKSRLSFTTETKDLEFVKWFIQETQITKTDDDDRIIIEAAFDRACEFGALDIARYLFEEYSVSFSDTSHLLYNVAREGHLDVIQFICDKLGATDRWAVESQDSLPSSLWVAAKEKHMNVVRWMKKTYTIIEQDLWDRNTGESIISGSLLYGSVDVAAELVKLFEIPMEAVDDALYQILSRKDDLERFADAIYKLKIEMTPQRVVTCLNKCAHGFCTNTAIWLIKYYIDCIPISDLMDFYKTVHKDKELADNTELLRVIDDYVKIPNRSLRLWAAANETERTWLKDQFGIQP